MMSNNVPQSNVSSNPSGANNTYSGDDSKTIGLVFHKSAVGTVKLMDMTTEISGSDYGIMYQGTLMVAKYALGHGILRPECAATIKLAALSPPNFNIRAVERGKNIIIIRYPFFYSHVSFNKEKKEEEENGWQRVT